MRPVSISILAAVAATIVSPAKALSSAPADRYVVSVPPYAAQAFPDLVKERETRLGGTVGDSTAAVLLVPLNHSSSSKSQEKIALRYWIDGSCYTKGGPVFVHLGGEGEQRPVPCGSRERVFGALSLSVEHRFYGKSHVANKTVAESLGLSYLQHLTVENALGDLKMVIDTVTDTLKVQDEGEDADAGVSSASPPQSPAVVSFGGSYSGGLSAFLRMAYPDSIAASVSESGVVSAVLNFTGFDAAISEAAATSGGQSDPCADNLRSATAAMERMAAGGDASRKRLLSIFNATVYLENATAAAWRNDDDDDYDRMNDFWYAVADGPAMLIQYGSKAALCDALATPTQSGSSVGAARASSPNRTDEEWAQTLAAVIAKRYGPSFASGCFYDTACFANASKAAAGSTSGALPMERQWRFQKCNEMAFLQAAPASLSVRSSSLTLEALKAQCRVAFGDDLGSDPANAGIVKRFGGYRPAGGNIFFLDYSDDPWRAATVDREWIENSKDASDRNLGFCYTECDGCGHCGAGVPRNVTECEDAATQWLGLVLRVGGDGGGGGDSGDVAVVE